MTANHSRLIERIKTILIVVLTFTTILLLYFFWNLVPGSETIQFKSMVDLVKGEEYVPPVSDVLIPKRITVSFVDDKGSYTSVEKGKIQYWNQAVAELKQFGKKTNVRVQELSDSQLSPREAYQRAMEKRSIEFSFSYDIPFGYFCDTYGIRRFQGSEMIQSFSSMAYSSYYDQDKSLLFYDRKNGKYYRVFTDKDSDSEVESSVNGFMEMIAQIENGGNYTPYYKATELFLGEDTQVDNHAFIPLTLQSRLQEFKCLPEFYADDADRIDDLAQTFFGKNFDFIRKVTESQGTVIFMYGYGQKVLTVNTDGTLVYKEEISEDGGSDQGFFSSLETALAFVAAHGTWESDMDGKELPGVLLSGVSVRDQGKKKAYRYSFDLSVGEEPVFSENGPAAVVEVCGGQVIYYCRNMIRFDQAEVMKILDSGSDRDTFPTVNMIAQNYDYIRDRLMDRGIIEEMEESEENLSAGMDATPYLEDIIGAVRSVQTGYVKPAGEEKAVPAWIATFTSADHQKTCDLYFDLYDNATPLTDVDGSELR